MNKCNWAILLVTFALIFIFSQVEVRGQEQWFPLDDGGWYTFKYSGFRLAVFGISLGDNVPPWESLIMVDRPECAKFELVADGRWHCGNPVGDDGVSLSFGYHFQITFNPDCEEDVCVSIKGHPEFKELCFENKKIMIAADILNSCKESVLNERFIDAESELYFEATLKGPENFEFPSIIFGKAFSSGGSKSIMLYNESGPGDIIIKYRSEEIFKTREVFGDFSSDNLIFKIDFGRTAKECIRVEEVHAFTIDYIIFADDIPLVGPFTGTYKACFPYNSHIKFGAVIHNLKSYWPREDCQAWYADLNGYFDSQLQQTSFGSIQPSESQIVTEPNESIYQLPGGTQSSYPGSYENLCFNWVLQISDGPERDILTDHTNMTIYNGFRANDIIFDNLPADNTIECGYELNVNADPQPELHESSRIIYDWLWEAESPEQHAYFDPNDSRFKASTFVANSPGDYEIWYKIEDTQTGDDDLSDRATIHVKPTLEIVQPAEDYFKYCFGDGTPGVLDIHVEGRTAPEELIEDVYWDVTIPQGTDQNANPNDQQGARVVFTLTGLPPENSAFGDFDGNNVVAATIELNDITYSVTRPIALFYEKEEFNHGAGNPDEINWFHYWKQGAVPGLADSWCVYEPLYDYYCVACHDWPTRTIKITNNAATEYQTVPIPGIFINFCNKQGVDCAESTCRHEFKHREIYLNWAEPNGIWYIEFGIEHPCLHGAHGEARKIPDIDSDGDMLPDNWETELTEYGGVPISLDPQCSDTYDLVHHTLQDPHWCLPDLFVYGDQELLCRITETEIYGFGAYDWSKGAFSKNW